MDFISSQGALAISFAIMIIMLICLFYVISLQKSLMRRLDNEKAEGGSIPDSRVNSAPVKYEDDEEIVAAISAAVAEFIGKPQSRLVIRSIKRTGSINDPWSMAGRQDLMGSRLS